MNAELSSNTKAILLLTAPLLVGRGKGSGRPLSVLEYDRLARRLRERGRQPADLLGPEAGAALGECQPGFDDARIGQLLERGFLFSQAIDHWQARAIWVISRADPAYPTRFKSRLRQFAPPVLYGCGDANLLKKGGVAVVGSRKVSDELKEYAKRIGRLAAAAQCTVISGGARGVDRAAMHGALTEGGTVVGVLADSLEKAAMDRGNREALVAGRLVLISPYDPRAGFNVGNAMQRNKLIYGLADAGLIVESDYNKGGTWTGAVEQLDKLRLVPIYARIDGEISKGISELQRKGACRWPAPKTADGFRAVLAGEQVHSETESILQSFTPLDCGEAAKAHDDIGEQTVPSVPAAEPESMPGVTPADKLLVEVERLLKEIDKPIKPADVAEYLEVSRPQATDWLKRLEQAGKYKRRNKRAPYERVAQVDPLFR